MNSEKELTEPLKIIKKVYQGYGLADRDGRKVFINCAVPGDKVIARLTRRKKDVYFGEIERLIKESADRREPGCESFGSCGGCDWLNIKREKQLEYKEQIIDEIFYNLKIEKRLPIGYTEQEYHYRNKCVYPVNSENGEPGFGIYARLSHEVIKHSNCLIQAKIFDEIAETICQYIMSSGAEVYNEASGKGNVRYIGCRMNSGTGEIQVVVVCRKRKLPFTKQLVRLLTTKFPQIKSIIQNINSENGKVILGSEEKLLLGNKYLNLKVGGKEFEVAYNSFFQVNIEVTEELIRFCREYLPATGCLVDAYCGTGMLGICLADKIERLIGIDNSENAIRDAIQNAHKNGITNCNFICGETMLALPEILETEQVKVILFDPPRKGLSSDIIQVATENKVPLIIYISCNPSTQARDIRQFIGAGYKVSVMKAFDMFPQTWHIENVAILEKE